MVTTRRSSARAALLSQNITTPADASSTDTTTRVTHARTKNTKVTVNGSEIPLARELTPSNSIIGPDLSLILPATYSPPRDRIKGRELADVALTDTRLTPRTIYPVLALTAPQLQGTAQDPIVLGNSPISRPIELQKRKRRRKTQEPHKFLEKGYRELYNYRPLRPALEPGANNSSTFTGDRNHDIHRMMNAKIEAESHATRGPYKHAGHTLPFEVRHSISARHPAQQPGGPSKLPYTYEGYYSYPNLPWPHPVTPVENEETLRKRALQLIRNHSQSASQKRKLFDVDPDETSTSESEDTSSLRRRSTTRSRSTSNNPIPPRCLNPPAHRKPDAQRSPPFPSIANTTLLTTTKLQSSLIQIYPSSSDQRGLLTDIALLAAIQNQQLEQWSRSEIDRFNLHRTDSGNGVSGTHRAVQAGQQAAKDIEMRDVLSATAVMWGGGGGLAEVFGGVEVREDISGSRQSEKNGCIRTNDGGEVNAQKDVKVSLDGQRP
ncbi:hypothetical protein ACN47E_006150 [Coniothyrium glycines]